MDFPSILRASGCNVAEVSGWQTRERPGSFAPVGVIIHHTAGHNDLNVIVNGRSDLPGPLSNLWISKAGKVHVVSDGRCNHAGNGAQVVLDEVRIGRAPSGDAAARNLSDSVNGNSYFYGIEAENYGDGKDPWPPAQLEAIARSAAALCKHHGWSGSRAIGHREWTRRKIDPRGFSMQSMRERVRSLATQTEVKPMFNPSLIMEPIVGTAKDSATGGIWLLAESGAIYAFENARGVRGTNGRSYFAGRKAATFDRDQDGFAVAPAGKILTVIATSGERYDLPDGLVG